MKTTCEIEYIFYVVLNWWLMTDGRLLLIFIFKFQFPISANNFSTLTCLIAFSFLSFDLKFEASEYRVYAIDCRWYLWMKSIWEYQNHQYNDYLSVVYMTIEDFRVKFYFHCSVPKILFERWFSIMFFSHQYI